MNAMAEKMGLPSFVTNFPIDEDLLSSEINHLEEQNRFFEELNRDRDGIADILNWAPELPDMPVDREVVDKYKALVDKQLAHGQKLLKTYDKWPKSTLRRFPLPEPPYTQLIVRAHIEVVSVQLVRLKKKQIAMAVLIFTVIVILLSILSIFSMLGSQTARGALGPPPTPTNS